LKGYTEDLMEAFENDIFPDIGKRPFTETEPYATTPLSLVEPKPTHFLYLPVR
jgi:hypothetical protein